MIVNLYEAKTHLSELVEQAVEGKEIVIAKAGRPRVRLVPISTPAVLRKPGGWENKVRMTDDFDDPLPEEILRGFSAED